MKVKSVSVQSLENLVKQMVNGALENDDEATKLHQMIYEEWYFKKFCHLKKTKMNENEMELLKRDSQEGSIAETVVYRRVRPHKCKRKHIQSSAKIDFSGAEINGNNLDVKNSCQNFVTTDDQGDTNVTPIHSAKLSSDRISVHNGDANVENSAEVIEIWNVKKKSGTKSDNYRNSCNALNNHYDRQSNGRKVMDKLSFEAWKRKKTIACQRYIKDKEMERQQQIDAHLGNIERKRAMEREYAWRNQQRRYERKVKQSEKYVNRIQRKTPLVNPSYIQIRRKDGINKHPTSRESNCAQLSSNAERMQATRRESMKSAVAATGKARKTNTVSKSQRDKVTSLLKRIESATFKSWLNQLNCTLREKYSRERRYLVRSFYCQPVYYGCTSPNAR